MIKLLIVDDEKGLCEYLKDFFVPRGYEVLTAQDGESTLDLVKKQKPELVLLDINMPKTSGLEVLRQIKQLNSSIKVIMVTVSDDEDTRQKATELGANGFVKKPFTIDYLEDEVILKVSEIAREKENPKILIVDDEDQMRRTLKSFFSERFECDIFEAANAKKAIELLKKERIDLVLLDIKMPGISGMEVIKEKKKLAYKPEILVITKFDSWEVAHKVIEEGATDYIPKPFSLRVLNIKIRDLLAKIGKYKPRVA